MRKSSFCVFLILVFFSKEINSVSVKNGFANDVLSNIVDELLEDGTHCLRDLKRIFEGVKNSTTWATWVVDSMQLPVGSLYGSRYHLGNFDQCLDDTWSSTYPELETQYCLVDVTAKEIPAAQQFHPHSDADGFIKSKSGHGRRRFLNSFGVCVPSSCSPRSVEQIAKHIISSSHLHFVDVTSDSRNCQTLNRKLEYSTGFYVFWIILLFTTATAVYAFVKGDYSNWFSPQRNLAVLTSSGKDDVNLLHGVCVVCSSGAVIVHNIYYVHTMAVINMESAGKFIESFVGQFIGHFDITIDTLVVLSGIITMRSLLLNRGNIFKTLLTYTRYFTPYAMILLYMVSVSPHSGSGPLWPKFLKEEHEPCDRNWWTALLAMGNVVKTHNICYVSTWYMSCDVQLTVLGVIIFYFWMLNRRAGLVMFISMMLLSIVLPAVQVYWFDLPPMLLKELDDSSLNLRMNPYYTQVYMQVHSRLFAYLLGFLTGFIITVYNPENYGKKFSKTSSRFVILLILCIELWLSKFVGSLSFKPNDRLESAIIVGLDKIIYSAGICMFILVCEYGSLQYIPMFFRSKILVPLSRLSYGVYLVNAAVITRNVYSLKAPATFDIFHLLVNSFGYVISSYALSFIQWFIIEAPSRNMFNYLLNERDQKKE